MHRHNATLAMLPKIIKDPGLLAAPDYEYRMNQFEFTAVGVIESPYKQKFAIPRQPGLIAEARGHLVLSPPFADDAIVRGIDSFSHLWLVFVFHETADKGWSPLVRPPRLGGNEKKGVFATRATFRPNPIGLSVVKLDGVERRGEQLVLKLSGIDLLDGTPVLDIKPYLPYADALPNAASGFADAAPRPPYKKQRQDTQSYGMNLYNFNIKWTVDGDHNHVTEIRIQQQDDAQTT
jgi:tRNA-Thr(GGU) m(6)t(6)A37 methyltransferase TsaA